jgi:AraC-like DNA-binding protein
MFTFNRQNTNNRTAFVRYFATKLNLSATNFSDRIKDETGQTVREFIQAKVSDVAKKVNLEIREIIGSGKAM